MVGNIITDPKTGEPLDNNGNKLSVSAYNPPKEVMDLFARVQQDYQVAYGLSMRPFDEFDGVSLIQRAKLDQELFGAFVGAQYLPQHKKWRWRGRKNTSRNKIIKILAYMLAGMLYPFVRSKNAQNEEDKDAAHVMGILVEEHLKKSGYEVKFLFMVLSALANPAVYVHVEYVEAIQKVKQQLASGEWTIIEAVDEILSGTQLNIRPIDEVLLPDYFSGTGEIQKLPNLLLIRRISYDQARAENAGKYFDENGKDLFDYVQPGKTRIFMSGSDKNQLYDIEWTEADSNYVQEIIPLYRSEDLQLKWVGGVGLFNYKDPYNTNPFEHRRMQLVKDKWVSVPIYPIAMSGYEPIDPTGRFAFYKSAAFKEFWDDKSLNTMHQLVMDGTYLDVIKPIFISGVSKVDSIVIAPGAVTGMPSGARTDAYSMSPNLPAAFQAMTKQETDLADSTTVQITNPTPTANVPATQTNAAIQDARLKLGVFGIMIAKLIEDVGSLVVDCVAQNATVGELDYSVPDALSMRYKTFLVKGKDKGKNVTHKVMFTDKYMGRNVTDAQKNKIEWDLYNQTGKTPKERANSDQRIYLVNPYQFVRNYYSLEVDADAITSKSMGVERQENQIAFNMLTDPRVLPFVDPEAVVNDFVIEEYGGDDPDRYKRKGGPSDMMNSIMGQQGSGPAANMQRSMVGASQKIPQTTQ